VNPAVLQTGGSPDSVPFDIVGSQDSNTDQFLDFKVTIPKAFVQQHHFRFDVHILGTRLNMDSTACSLEPDPSHTDTFPFNFSVGSGDPANNLAFRVRVAFNQPTASFRLKCPQNLLWQDGLIDELALEINPTLL